LGSGEKCEEIREIGGKKKKKTQRQRLTSGVGGRGKKEVHRAAWVGVRCRKKGKKKGSQKKEDQKRGARG